MNDKDIKDLTTVDLLAEGRRWVPYPGEKLEDVTRLQIVFEKHPFRFCVGQISNDPSTLPPLVIESDDPHAWCVLWSIDNELVKDTLEYHLIVASSIGAQSSAMAIHVFCEDPDCITLQDGIGNSIQIDEDSATKLYQRLGQIMDLPHQVYCPHCDDPLMNYETCPCENERGSKIG